MQVTKFNRGGAVYLVIAIGCGGTTGFDPGGLALEQRDGTLPLMQSDGGATLVDGQPTIAWPDGGVARSEAGCTNCDGAIAPQPSFDEAEKQRIIDYKQKIVDRTLLYFARSTKVIEQQKSDGSFKYGTQQVSFNGLDRIADSNVLTRLRYSPIDGHIMLRRSYCTLPDTQASSFSLEASKAAISDHYTRITTTVAQQQQPFVDARIASLAPTFPPLLHFARMMGRCAVKAADDTCAKSRCYCSDARKKQVNCFALKDGQPALELFLQEYEQALRMAKATRAAGIAIDPAPYVDKNAYSLTKIATSLQADAALALSTLAAAKTFVRTQLRAVGARLADLTALAYPTAKIFALQTGMHESEDKRATQHIFIGMLDRANRCFQRIASGCQAPERYSFLLFEGGDTTVKRAHFSLEDLEAKLVAQERAYADFLRRYPRNLRLAAPIVLWHDLKKDYPASHTYRKQAERTDLKTGLLKQQQQILTRLLRRRELIWFIPPTAVRRFHNDFATAADQSAWSAAKKALNCDTKCKSGYRGAIRKAKKAAVTSASSS